MKIRTCQLLSDGLNCAPLSSDLVFEAENNNGTWRSLVARFAGGEEVAGSNPVVPTIQKNGITNRWFRFFITGLQDENAVRAHSPPQGRRVSRQSNGQTSSSGSLDAGTA